MSRVPQGSVLGPILFILFINDLEACLPNRAISTFFADDFKSYIPVSNTAAFNDFNQLLDSVANWSITWQLPLSIEKCSYMILSNKLCKNKFDFLLSGVDLSESSQVKDLGVLFNCTLNFSSHISEIVGKAKQRLYLLRKCFTACNDTMLIHAFKVYIIPLLEYCSPVWSPHTLTDILRVESVQRTFTKSLPSCRDLSYKNRLQLCGLSSLERRRLVADLVLFYKIVNKIVLIDLGVSLQPIGYSVTRGHSRRYKVPSARIDSRMYSFVIRTIKIWNDLNEQLVCSDSVASFKKSISMFDLSKFLIIGF